MACFPIIADIRACMLKFESCLVRGISRERNKMAHALAASARMNGDQELFDGVPDHLQVLLCNDAHV